jgi:hypothetical protein
MSVFYCHQAHQREISDLDPMLCVQMNSYCYPTHKIYEPWGLVISRELVFTFFPRCSHTTKQALPEPLSVRALKGMLGFEF